MEALLLTILGALIPTFFLSRLFRWLLAKRGIDSLTLPHAITYGTCVLLYAFGAANGGPLQFMEGAVVYALPVVVWLTYDNARARKSARVV